MEASVEDGVDGVLVATLDAGESLLAAGGALVDHTGGVRVERAPEGSLRSVANAARRREQSPVRVVADEAATVRFAPDGHGEVVACEAADGVAAVRSAFLAATGDVDVNVDRVGSAPDRGVGLFLTSFAGDATVYLAGRGRVERVDVAADDERVVAADHVVAFDDRASVTVRRVSALEDADAVCRVRGPGAVWVATRPLGPSAN